MTLHELTHAEKLALVGLARMMIRADGSFSREEVGALGRIADELGADELDLLIGESRTFDDETVKARVHDVARRPAQELIYGALFELATAGTIEESERVLLDWLSETWSIAADIDPYRG